MFRYDRLDDTWAQAQEGLDSGELVILMLWDPYVFRRGRDANELWERLFERRPVRLLYIAGAGFDVRAQAVMRECIDSMRSAEASIEAAELVLVGFSSYRLDASLKELTEQNGDELANIFSTIGSVEHVQFGGGDDDEELSASSALRQGTDKVLEKVFHQTDIILDASSLPRVAYLALMTSLLNRLIPNKKSANALAAGGVNFQVLVAEDANLDAQIMAEDPSSDVVLVPGFLSAMQVESVRDWPLVWFPILGEHRVNQLRQVARLNEFPADAEVCPVLPHPSRDPRRADNLLIEYKGALFDAYRGLISNILYVHESQPFEAYRQLFGAMQRYRESMRILGGCRLVVTPFGSKLITIGAGLACFEMRPTDLTEFGVAIPHAEPKRYVADADLIQNSRPEICVLLLTGEAYAQPVS